jgi:hypothetical protein
MAGPGAQDCGIWDQQSTIRAVGVAWACPLAPKFANAIATIVIDPWHRSGTRHIDHARMMTSCVMRLPLTQTPAPAPCSLHKEAKPRTRRSESRDSRRDVLPGDDCHIVISAAALCTGAVPEAGPGASLKPCTAVYDTPQRDPRSYDTAQRNALYFYLGGDTYRFSPVSCSPSCPSCRLHCRRRRGCL